ncbi:MAG: dihydroorotate dehydrogenase (quinone) [Anaerolineaceae bacterium]|nr:quinone-dependent dihydroorotate dehydrogenase [Chloroflexi bacterium CFX2]GJQ34185.1 MAG: dihydroorotate dehydrogenase (quinone) [Anaerolineaceae bacterium]
MYSLLRPLLFRLDPERAHALTLHALRIAGNFPPSRKLLEFIYKSPPKPVQVFGLTFKNPIGLAAGYDKDGVAIRGLAALGFGHVEIGTVTPKPQPGNPSPRVFRLAEDEAVINRMGFPSRGSEFVQGRLSPAMQTSRLGHTMGIVNERLEKRRKWNTVLGVNLGKNRETSNEDAVLDYLALLQIFAGLADYLTINVSSPNTVGLRNLQGRKALEGLLAQLHRQRLFEEQALARRIPILVKLAPDLSESELNDAVEAILNTEMDGIIVTNTTLGREGLRSNDRGETGGLSGSPLRVKSEAVLCQTLKHVNGRIPVVSAGGIMNPDDAKRRLEMGAALVQIYTGLIYRGPGLVKAIVTVVPGAGRVAALRSDL